MEKNRKKIRRVCWIIVIVGSFMLGVARAMFNLSDLVNRLIYVSWTASIVVGGVTVNLLWYKEFSKKLDEINLILKEQGDADKYIIELNALMEGKHSLQLRQVHMINLSAAYIQKKDYEKAKSLLLQIKPSKLVRVHKVVYWANLALIYFYLKEEQSACSIMEQQKNNFKQFKEGEQLGQMLAILDIFYLITSGEKEKAWSQLEEVRKKWESPRNASEFLYLETLIVEQQ